MVEANYGPIPPKPTCWADVFAVTGELSAVLISEIEQGRLDWEYHFSSSDMRPCGRKGCKQEHGHGWLVALRDGRYVHIGNDCAKNHANPDWMQSQVSGYNDRVKKEAQAQAVVHAREKAQAVAYWLDCNLQLPLATKLYQSFVSEVRGSLLSDLRKRADKMESEVKREVRLSDSEVKRRRESATIVKQDGTSYTPHIPTSEFVLVGRLKGIGCFKNDIVDLVRSIERDAKYLLLHSHGEISKRELDFLREAINRVGIAQRLVERIIGDIASFFSEPNLDLVLKMKPAQSQGIVGITVQPDHSVVLTRRSHWGAQAA